MNRTVFSLPATSDYRTAAGLAVTRVVESFTGGQALDDLIDLLDRRRGVMLSSGTTVPGRYESFDLGFADPPLALTTRDGDFAIEALNHPDPLDNHRVALTVDAPLYDPSVRPAVRAATIGAEIAGASKEGTERTLRASVTAAYAAVLSADATRVSLAAALARAEADLALAEQRRDEHPGVLHRLAFADDQLGPEHHAAYHDGIFDHGGLTGAPPT